MKPGVRVHIHDVHFPFNTPFPADTWLFGERWPVYWNEAMVVQAFLAFNASFEVHLSVPMIRHHDEAFLRTGSRRTGRWPRTEPAVVTLVAAGVLGQDARAVLRRTRPSLAGRGRGSLAGLRAGRVLSS